MDEKSTTKTSSSSEFTEEKSLESMMMTLGSVAPVANSEVFLDVKSTAVVKYSSVKFPVQFSTIRLNTDLNHPPSDRQCSGYYMFSDQHMEQNTAHFSEFSSLNMADAYQDLVGQVDVISSSKNIKALLKMPYTDSPHISIMVHRLRKTLLLEEFDVHKNLIKKQAEEWSWLKSYFQNVIVKGQEDKTKWLVSANPKRDSFTENMYMNLIRHSFAASIGDKQCTALQAAEDKSKQVHPIPESSEDLKGFHHETLWKFEDISMLIDSDLPIFGSGETPRPCISLRLRDARSPPINILTGLDYWLDNLMSNVPEVAMCYHVNGLVQKYEVMRTEDIPNLENSKFDPNEVLDIAQNIMSFIKRNAAVEGHTYWLYKSQNDEMVKLYDLTDYCKNEIAEGDNPFTVPVGLLCHRVGRNLKRSGQRRMADARAMFENCLRLLEETKHAQVCADAHFHLCDMWVPDKSVNDVWQEKGKISEPPVDLYDEDETSSDESSGTDVQSRKGIDNKESEFVKAVKGGQESLGDGCRDGEVMKNSVALKELVVRGMIKRKAWEVVHACRIAGTTDERCHVALSHIRKGLNCVDKDQSKGKNIGLVEKQQTCSPSKAIPLYYQPLNIHTQDRAEQTTGEEPKEPQMCNPLTPIPLNYTPLNKPPESSVDAGPPPETPGHLNVKAMSQEPCRMGPPPSETPGHLNVKAMSQEPCRKGPPPSETPGHLNVNAMSQEPCRMGPPPSETPGHLNVNAMSQEPCRMVPAAVWEPNVFKSESETESSSGSVRSEKLTLETWHVQAKFDLLRKAAITYFVLAKEFFEIKKYGHTLRHLRYAVHCYEAIELMNKSMKDESSHKEMYLMLLYLAAQARCCMLFNWHQCHRDFEELGEEEAAILHSAQAVVATPKNAWVYDWPNSQESNMLTANELYEQAFRLPVLEKKPTNFRILMKKNHALCVMNLGNTQMEICKEKVTNGKENYENIKNVWEKSLKSYQKAIRMFESVNDRNTAGHICSNVAYLHVVAAAGVHNSSEDNVFSTQEKDFLAKAIEWYEKGLCKYERGEGMDDARESIYHNMRMQYQEMALRYFRIPSGLVTDQDLRTMKELINKSLSYCFLDPVGKHVKKSQICAGLNHLNMARIFDVESVNCVNNTRKRNLKQKMEEHFLKAFDIYGIIRWRRSQMCVKFCWINTLVEESETKTLSNPTKKKIVRTVFFHLCDLLPSLLSMANGDFDDEDNNDIYSTNFSSVKQLHAVLNGAFSSYLRMDICNSGIKQLYERSLRLSNLTKLEDLQPPLASILTDLKSVLSTESVH